MAAVATKTAETHGETSKSPDGRTADTAQKWVRSADDRTVEPHGRLRRPCLVGDRIKSRRLAAATEENLVRGHFVTAVQCEAHGGDRVATAEIDVDEVVAVRTVDDQTHDRIDRMLE